MSVSVNPQVVIVGCGISGVAAARRLVKAGRIKTGRLGNNITEIGASYIHGPSEANPLFCLARDYGLLAPEALTPENQAMNVDERPPRVPNWFSSSDQRLSAKDMNPALEMFNELLADVSQFENQTETPWTSVGDYIRGTAASSGERWKDKGGVVEGGVLCQWDSHYG